MAYFANGTEGRDWESQNCDQCLHNNEELAECCPVWAVHQMWNYDQHGKGKTAGAVKDILDELIPSDKSGTPKKCPLFIERTSIERDTYLTKLQRGEAVPVGGEWQP